MSGNIRDNRQPAKNGRNEQQTPQQRHQNWVEDSVGKIKQGTHGVIQQKTRDTAETKNFINIIDSLMFNVRMNAGISRNIPAEALQGYIDRVRRAKEELNLVAAEMCRDMGRPYRPPRGYTNPLQSSANNQQGSKKKKNKPKQTAPAAVEAEPAKSTPPETPAA